MREVKDGEGVESQVVAPQHQTPNDLSLTDLGLGEERWRGGWAKKEDFSNPTIRHCANFGLELASTATFRGTTSDRR